MAKRRSQAPRVDEHGFREELRAGLDAAIKQLTPPAPLTTKWGALVNDPVAWARQRLGVTLWSMQGKVAQSVVQNRYTAVPSCHATGKSFNAGGVLAPWWIDTHDPGTAFVVTTAPTDSQVKSIMWRELRRSHRKGKLGGRVTLDAQWYLTEIGDELVGIGRKPNDYNPDAFQGIHQRHILIIIDEANGVPKSMYDAVDALATNEHARVLAIGNPDTPGSHFETICKPGSGWNVIRIPYDLTPNFTGEEVPDGLELDLISEVWVEERRKRWGVDSPLFTSKCLAQFPDISDDTLIQPSWVYAAQDREIGVKVHGQAGFDIARYGVDQTIGYRYRNGNVSECLAVSQISTVKTSNHIRRLAKGWQDEVTIVIDEVGVGGGVVDNLLEENYPISPFNGGHTPVVEVDKFVNCRAEAYWHLRQLFERGEMDIPKHDDVLAAQLTSIKWFVNSKGKIGIESKEDYMKRMRTGSPDRADALSMACAPYREVQTVDLEEHYAEMGAAGTGPNIEEVSW